MKRKAVHHGNRSRQITSAFIAVAMLLGALTFARAVRFHVQDIAASAPGLAQGDSGALPQHRQQAKETADALKKANLFAQQPARKHPVEQIDGILGNEVLVADKWYAVGQKLSDAEIIAIGPTEVRIEWDGQEKTFSPMAAGSTESPPQRPQVARAPTERAPTPTESVAETPAQVLAAAPSPPPQADALAWMGVELPASVKEKLLEHWNRMSPEEQDEAKQEWNRMPDDEKRKAIEAMERTM